MSISDTEIRRLERIGARTWPARTTETLGGWRLSMDRGVTRRANSVLPNAWDGESSIDDRVAAVERRYRREGLAPCFKLTGASLPDGLDQALAHRGYRAEGHSDVLTAAVGQVDDRTTLPVEIAPEPTLEWLATCWPDGGCGRVGDPRQDIVDRIGGPRAFVLVRLDGRPAGAALAAADRNWVCIGAVHCLPAWRRRGVARALIASMAGWARRQEAEFLFLQVESDNRPGHGLYRAVGFQPAYRYHYRVLAS